MKCESMYKIALRWFLGNIHLSLERLRHPVGFWIREGILLLLGVTAAVLGTH